MDSIVSYKHKENVFITSRVRKSSVEPKHEGIVMYPSVYGPGRFSLVPRNAPSFLSLQYTSTRK